MPVIKAPDGKVIQFPDSMSETEITSVLDKEYNQPSQASPTQSFMEKLGRIPTSMAGGFNIGASNLAGMPVDIMNKILSLGKLNIPQPIGGSEWIKRLIPQTAKPEGFAETTAGAIGEQIPNAMTALITGGGASLIQQLMNAGKFAVGAGVGSGIARTVVPGNPWADLMGQLAGGVGGPLVTTLGPKIGEKIIAPIIGSRALTGAETETVLRAAKGTEAFRMGMKGNVNAQQIYNEADSALDKMLQTRSTEYKAALPELQRSKVNLDIIPLKDEMNKKLSEFGVQFNNQGKIIRSTLDRSTVKDAERVIDMIDNWGIQPGDLTPSGVDMLKRNLDSFYSPNKNISAFITPLRNKAKELITNEVPGYAHQMKKYEQWSELIRDIRQNLSMGDKSSIESGIRKLMSSLRDDNEFRRSLIQELEKMGQAPLLDKIAGLRMKGIIPLQHGGTQLVGAEILSSIITGNPKVLGGLYLASPRLMGETINALGRTWNLYKKVMPSQGLKNILFPSAANVLTQGQKMEKK